MKIKNMVAIFLFVFILASCAPAAKVIPTETAVPTSTFTPNPPAPTITPTLDPMINAPDHATAYDSVKKAYIWVDGNNIYYYDNERQLFSWEANDGYTYYYREIQLASGEIDMAWSRPLIENYYVYDFEDNSGWNYEGFNSIPIDVWVKYGTPGSESIVKMTHRDVVSSDDVSETYIHLNKFLIEKFQITDPPSMWEGLTSEAGLPFEFVFNKKVMHSSLGKNGGFQITFVSEEELKPLAQEQSAVRANGNLGFIYVIYDGVENSKVMVRVASSQPLNKLLGNSPAGDPQYELRKMLFLPLMNILVSDEGTDLINVAAQRDAGIVASRSAFPRAKDGVPDLQIEYK